MPIYLPGEDALPHGARDRADRSTHTGKGLRHDYDTATRWRDENRRLR